MAQRGQSIWTSEVHLSTGGRGVRGTWSLSPMIKSMHVHPVFHVIHSLCAKSLLEKIEILKKKKNQNESGKL